MRRSVLIVAAIVSILTIAVVSAWASLALWFRMPAPEIARAAAGGLFALLGVTTIVALFGRFRRRMLLSFGAASTGVLIWWSTIVPLTQADWAPSVARQVTGTIDGDKLTLTDVRDFEWRSNSDFTERWATRTYDLSRLRTLDLFLSYWGGPDMAHVMLSFGFEGEHYLVWSVEVRRRKGGEFSPIADLFKSDPLVIVAAEERDIVGVRSNIRGEDVQLYRLRATPDVARPLLFEYVTDANALLVTPEFYNSLTTNCATTVIKIIRAVGDEIPLDWQLVVDGYLPDYAYKLGALDTRFSLAELKKLSHIDQQAQAAGLSPDYSKLIRIGVPSPHDQGGGFQ
jgi:hypothetical protein